MKKIYISFKNEPEGILTEERVQTLFCNPSKMVGIREGFLSIVKDPHDPVSNVLRVTYPKGIIQEDKTRVRIKFPAVESATVTYAVLFPKDFDFVRGGKLPGFAGGSSPSGGKKSDGSDGFSVRVMWRERGEIFQYMYWMERAPEKKWGDNLPWIDLSGDKRPLRFIPGTWHTLTTRITMNAPGKRDGTVTSQLDGKHALSAMGAFRAVGTDFGIDQLLFTTFFDGNDLTWAPKKEERVYFGDITIEFE